MCECGKNVKSTCSFLDFSIHPNCNNQQGENLGNKKEIVFYLGLATSILESNGTLSL